jgi:hypothetical protein
VGSCPLFLLIVAAAVLFRGHGDSWPHVVVKLMGIVVLSLAAVGVLAGLAVWWPRT